MQTVSHKALFEKFRDDSVIEKCAQYAEWTLAQLMADVHSTGGKNVVVERDYQEMGALLTNNLATKLAGILFPTSQPFFRVSASEAINAAAAEKGMSTQELQAVFARLEMASSRRTFMNAGYAQVIMAIKHLIVTGNALLYRDTTNHTFVTYGLRDYVVRRDGNGELLDCILRQTMAFQTLEDAVKRTLQSTQSAKYANEECSVELYTRISRSQENGKVRYKVTQEIDNTPVGEGSSYPKDLCPWFVLNWSLIAGEHYGRGMVEDYAGGFAKLSDLSEAQALYSIEMMRVIHLVGAGAGTDIDDLVNAETGAYVRGDPAQVQAQENGDAQKMAQVSNEIQQVFGRLARAFMYTANTRNAERVTAYELERDAKEAENTLGGTYSTLSAAMQVPMAHVLMLEENDSTLAGLITGELKLNVEAGLPALGRSSDVQNLLLAAQEAAAVIPIAQMDKRLDPRKILDMIFNGRSVDVSQVFFSDAEQKANDAADAQLAQGQAQIMQSATLADANAQLNTLQGQQ